MSDSLMLLVDPVFAQPFLTGLAYAVLLPLVGAYLRLRDEWLAALAFAQTAAAGALLAMLAGVPLLLGGLLAGLAAAGLKHKVDEAARGVQGATYALLLVAAWALAILLVANQPLAERLGHALFDGQLYFTGRDHLIVAGICIVVAGVALRHLSRDLLLGVSVPYGPGKFIASYIRKDDRTAANYDANQLAIGYVYNLSKRTSLYTAIARIHNNALAGNTAGFYRVGNSTEQGSGSRAFNLGIRHAF